MDTDALLGDAHLGLVELDLGDLTEGTLDDLGTRYDHCQDIIALAKQASEHLEIALVEAMPEPTMLTMNSVIKREKTKRWTWKEGTSGRAMRSDIEHNVATKLATNVATGEVDAELRNVITNAIHELWAVLPAPSSMKMEGAARFGLNIFDYRDLAQPEVIKVVPRSEAP